MSEFTRTQRTKHKLVSIHEKCAFQADLIVISYAHIRLANPQTRKLILSSKTFFFKYKLNCRIKSV